MKLSSQWAERNIVHPHMQRAQALPQNMRGTLAQAFQAWMKVDSQETPLKTAQHDLDMRMQAGTAMLTLTWACYQWQVCAYRDSLTLPPLAPTAPHSDASVIGLWPSPPGLASLSNGQS